MRGKRWVFGVAMLSALTLALGACSKQKDTGFNNLPKPPASAGGGGSSADIMLMSGNTFSPATLQAKVGQKVTWRNDDNSGQPHNVVSDTGLFDSAPNCSKDTSTCMKPGDTFSFTFTKPGKYPYYCVIHGFKGGGGMSGVVEVS